MVLYSSNHLYQLPWGTGVMNMTGFRSFSVNKKWWVILPRTHYASDETPSSPSLPAPSWIHCWFPCQIIVPEICHYTFLPGSSMAVKTVTMISLHAAFNTTALQVQQYIQSPLLGIFPISFSVVSGCSFGKGIEQCGKWLWFSCKGLSGVSCGTEVQQQQPGQINCCKEWLCSWLCSSSVPDSLGSQSRSLTGMEMTHTSFTDWVFCSLVDWNCSAKDQFIVKDEHLWSWEREEQPCLISAVMAKPVSSICTLIRGGKVLL